VVAVAGLMAFTFASRGKALLAVCILLLVLPSPTAAFGAGNIPGASLLEGVNWRHGGLYFISNYFNKKASLTVVDIEDMLKTIAFLKGHKWSTMMIKRVYFGNWLRGFLIRSLGFERYQLTVVRLFSSY
jgi:hypothetical protein